VRRRSAILLYTVRSTFFVALCCDGEASFCPPARAHPHGTARTVKQDVCESKNAASLARSRAREVCAINPFNKPWHLCLHPCKLCALRRVGNKLGVCQPHDGDLGQTVCKSECPLPCKCRFNRIDEWCGLSRRHWWPDRGVIPTWQSPTVP
jgi:hypothetical protein